MPFQKNNKDAETITLDSAIELCNKALNTVNDECYFISSVADKCDTYRQKFDYILKKYSDNKDVFNTIKRMYNKCESIVMEKTAQGEITPALGIFVLKAYHGLMESSRHYNDHTTKGESMNQLTAEQLREKSKQLDDEYK